MDNLEVEIGHIILSIAICVILSIVTLVFLKKRHYKEDMYMRNTLSARNYWRWKTGSID